MIWSMWQTVCKNVNITAFFCVMRVNIHPIPPLHCWDSCQLMRAPMKTVCCGSSFKANMRYRKDSKGISMELRLYGLQVLTTAAYRTLSNMKKAICSCSYFFVQVCLLQSFGLLYLHSFLCHCSLSDCKWGNLGESCLFSGYTWKKKCILVSHS